MPEQTLEDFMKQSGTPGGIVPQVGTVQQGPANLDPAWNAGIDIARPFIGNLGAVSAEALAPPGTKFAAGTGTYAGLDYLLKNLKTQQNPEEEGFDSSLKEALTNQVANRLLGGVFAGVKAFRNSNIPEIYKYAPTTSQALESYGMHALATSSKFLEDYFARPAKARALDKSAGEGFSQALAFSNLLDGKGELYRDPTELLKDVKTELEKGLTPGAQPGQFQTPQHYASQEALNTLKGQGQDPFGAINDVLYNDDKLKKVLMAEKVSGPAGSLNVREDLAGFQFRKMITDATTMGPNGKPRIDPNALAKIWNEPKYQPALETLYGSNKDDADKIVKNIMTTQDAMMPIPRGRLGYVGGGLFALSLPQILQHMNMQGIGNEAATAAALVIPAASIGRLLTKTGTAKFVQGMLEGRTLPISSKYAARFLTDALQGTKIGIQNADGSRIWGDLSTDKDTGEPTFTKQ